MQKIKNKKNPFRQKTVKKLEEKNIFSFLRENILKVISRGKENVLLFLKD